MIAVTSIIVDEEDGLTVEGRVVQLTLVEAEVQIHLVYRLGAGIYSRN